MGQSPWKCLEVEEIINNLEILKVPVQKRSVLFNESFQLELLNLMVVGLIKNEEIEKWYLQGNANTVQKKAECIFIKMYKLSDYHQELIQNISLFIYDTAKKHNALKVIMAHDSEKGKLSNFLYKNFRWLESEIKNEEKTIVVSEKIRNVANRAMKVCKLLEKIVLPNDGMGELSLEQIIDNLKETEVFSRKKYRENLFEIAKKSLYLDPHEINAGSEADNDNVLKIIRAAKKMKTGRYQLRNINAEKMVYLLRDMGVFDYSKSSKIYTYAIDYLEWNYTLGYDENVDNNKNGVRTVYSGQSVTKTGNAGDLRTLFDQESDFHSYFAALLYSIKRFEDECQKSRIKQTLRAKAIVTLDVLRYLKFPYYESPKSLGEPYDTEPYGNTVLAGYMKNFGENKFKESIFHNKMIPSLIHESPISLEGIDGITYNPIIDANLYTDGKVGEIIGAGKGTMSETRTKLEEIIKEEKKLVLLDKK
ncbi:hypothetical protein [Enterococcus sp. AZ109]|uniref:hypothetical protein n=1 Tax=Enterococcus sp. AZ109 TaxID=2774634 RepID=UPI003F2251B3